jgi:hypothetical protein
LVQFLCRKGEGTVSTLALPLTVVWPGYRLERMFRAQHHDRHHHSCSGGPVELHAN